jgi:PAS domain S-box-containing protein
MDLPERKKSLPFPPIPKEYLRKWHRLLGMIKNLASIPAIVVTRIEEAQVKNLVSTSDREELVAESTVALEKSLCRKVLESKKAVFFPGNAGIPSYSGYPLFLPNGEIFGTVCLFDVEKSSQDDLVKEITWFIEEDLAQLAKRHDLENYERVIQAVHDPVSIVDRDLKYVVVNRAYEEHFGVKQKDFLGTPVEWYFPPEDYVGIVKPYMKLCLQGETVTYEAWITFAGFRRFMDVTYYPLYQAGEVEGVVVTARDMTSIKKIEDSLSEAENDIAYSLGSSEDVVIIVGRDFVVQEVNEAGLELFMKDRKDVVGEKCYRLLHGNDYPARHCPVLKALISGTEEVMERYEPLFDSYYSIKCTPVKDAYGKIEKFIHVIKDVSEKAEPQRALALSEANLRAILNTTFVSYILLDVEWRITEFNPIAGMRMLEITGFILEKGKKILDYIPAALKTSFRNYLSSAVAGVPLKTERGFETSSGSQQWYEFDFIPVQKKGQEISGVVISAADITDRKLKKDPE